MASGTDGIREEVRAFLRLEIPEVGLGDDDDIFGTGAVNSLFAMELITFLEGTFDLTIENEDLDLEAFSTVNRLVDLVERKLAAGRLSA